MLQNRLLWIGVALALFALVAAVFRLRLQQARRRCRKKATRAATAAVVAATDAGRRACATTAAWWRAYWCAGPFPFPLDRPRSAIPRHLGDLRRST